MAIEEPGQADAPSSHGSSSPAPLSPHTLSVAPMMEWTDRHYRFMMRGITQKTHLYTEMYVDNTVRTKTTLLLTSDPCATPLHSHLPSFAKSRNAAAAPPR